MHFLIENGHFAFLSPRLRGGGLQATYTVDVRFIGKPVVDFLLVVIELFLLGVMAEALRAEIENRHF